MDCETVENDKKRNIQEESRCMISKRDDEMRARYEEKCRNEVKLR